MKKLTRDELLDLKVTLNEKRSRVDKERDFLDCIDNLLNNALEEDNLERIKTTPRTETWCLDQYEKDYGDGPGSVGYRLGVVLEDSSIQWLVSDKKKVLLDALGMHDLYDLYDAIDANLEGEDRVKFKVVWKGNGFAEAFPLEEE